MSNALTRAFAEVESAYLASKSIAGKPESLAGLSTGLGQAPGLTRAREQYSHFGGWVYVAVRAVAARLAGQSIFVGRPPRTRTRKGVGDGCEPLDSHWLLDLLADPNPIMPRWSVIYSAVASLLLTGRSFVWFADHQIWPIPTHWVEPIDLFAGTWKVRPGRGVEDFDLGPTELLAVELPDPSNPFGAVSPLQSQAVAVGTDEALQHAQHRSFANGIHPGVVLTVGRLPGMPSTGAPGERPALSQDQRRELTHAVKRAYSGVLKYGEPLILDGMIENVHKLTSSPQEMDFRNSGETLKRRILQAFGVNPIVCGEIEGANRASAAAAEQLFCENTCNPLATLLSESLTAFVNRRDGGEKVTVWIDPVRADDKELRLQEWKAARSLGDVSRNEFRRAVLNLGGVPGGDDFHE